MKIHHIRNATMLIEANDNVILVDPMLGPQGSMPTFTFFRFKARKNPIVPLPETTPSLLDRVTHALITHQHPDHIDKTGEKFLRERKTPVICSVKDESTFRKKGLQVTQTIEYWTKADFLGGIIEGIPARHGYGFISKPMGNVMGFYIELPGQPSLYLSSDTIYTAAVEQVLKTYKPAVAVVACGTAQLDLFQPLLMRIDDILRFVEDAPNKVIANHMEAVNHCPTSRTELLAAIRAAGLEEKIYIPSDGEEIVLT